MSAYLSPLLLERVIQYTLIPVLVPVILIIVAGSVLNLSFLKADAVLLLATFIYLSRIAIYIASSRLRHELNVAGQRGLWILIASLPLYAVRVVYLLLIEFGDAKFDPIVGDLRFLIGMAFAMEVGIVVLLVAAGVIVEPFWGLTPEAQVERSGGIGV